MDLKASAAMTPAAKKLLAAILLIFFLLFPHYSGYLGHHPSATFFPADPKFLFMLIHFVAGQTLGIVHEAGHGVCYILPCPRWIMVAMGTLFQWLFPAGIAWYFWRRGKRFGAMVALFFLGFSIQYTAWYISTAHEGLFVPASKAFLGVDGYHDFNYLLSQVGWVRYDGTIAGIVRFFAYLVMLAGVIGMVLESFVTEPEASGGKRRRH